ncbi:MAG TPA: hypothetical protein VEV38_00135 [Candidatus Eremiobacteraceae bacterium]|nr:hypothetical protein [Candidatus Eremiobacteraceae bacterium]
MNTVIYGLLSMRRVIAVAIAAVIAMSTFALPANADTAGQTSTRNLILAGLAATAAVILYNNYHHKYEAAHTIVGYTRDGGTVYADGRVVYPNGQTYYTGTSNGTQCSYNGYYTPCTGQVYAYGPPGRGHHYGWYKHRGDQDDQGDNDDNGGGN